MLLLDGKLTLFIFFVYIYAFVFVSLNECFTSSLFLFYKLSRKYVLQTKEHVKQRQKIPIFSGNFLLWSWKYKLKTCEKMYFKKLVRLQIFYIHKFLFYVILIYVTGSIYGGIQFFSSPVMVRGLAICMPVTPHCLRFLHMIIDFGEV